MWMESEWVDRVWIGNCDARGKREEEGEAVCVCVGGGGTAGVQRKQEPRLGNVEIFAITTCFISIWYCNLMVFSLSAYSLVTAEPNCSGYAWDILSAELPVTLIYPSGVHVSTQSFGASAW